MPEPTPTTKRRSDLAILAAAATLLLVVPCGIPTLWDKHEGRFLESARGMLATGDWVVPRILGEPVVFYPPLCAWLVAISAKLLGGLGEFSARFPSALAGVGCVLLAYEFGLFLFDRRTGIFAALALLTIPVWPKTAITCQPDTLVVFFLMTSLYAFLRIERAHERRWPWAVLFWVALAMNVLAKGPPGPVMTIAVAGAYVLWERNWKLALQLNPLLGLAVVAAIVPPWFLMAKHAAGPEYLRQMWDAAFSMAAGGQLLVHGQPPHYYLAKLWGAAPWLVFALAALVPASADLRERSAHRFLICWGGTMLILLSSFKAKRPYYLLPVFPAIAVLAASWWTRVPPWGSFASRWRERAPVLLLALATVAALVVPMLIPEGRLMKQDLTRGVLVFAGSFAALSGIVFLALHIPGRRNAGFVALASLLFVALAVQQTWGARFIDAEGRKGAAFCASVRPRTGPRARLVVHHVESFIPHYLDTSFEVANSPEEAAAAASEGAFLLTEKYTWESTPGLRAVWEPWVEAGTDMGNVVLCRPGR